MAKGLGLGLGLAKRRGGGAAPLWHVVIVGQSNANGDNNATLWPTTYPKVLGFATSSGEGLARPGHSGNAANFARLRPLLAATGGADPGGETMGIGLGYTLSQLSGHRVLVSVAADNATRINSRYQAGQEWFDAITYQVQKGVEFGAERLSIVSVQGETDTDFNNTSYGTEFTTFRANVATATGNSSFIIYIVQQVNMSTGASGTNGSWSTARMEDELAQATPSQFQVVHAPFAAEGDSVGGNLHRGNSSQRFEGGVVGAAIYRKEILAESKVNVRMIPGQVTLSGSTITANFSVPAGTSLAFDYSLVGKNTTAAYLRGVSYYDDAGTPVTVTGVSITDADTISVTLSGAPTGTAGSRKLRVGWGTGTGSQNRWAPNGRVNLCAPSSLTGVDGAPIGVNFATIQQEAVT